MADVTQWHRPWGGARVPIFQSLLSLESLTMLSHDGDGSRSMRPKRCAQPRGYLQTGSPAAGYMRETGSPAAGYMRETGSPAARYMGDSIDLIWRKNVSTLLADMLICHVNQSSSSDVLSDLLICHYQQSSLSVGLILSFP